MKFWPDTCERMGFICIMVMDGGRGGEERSQARDKYGENIQRLCEKPDKVEKAIDMMEKIAMEMKR